jgi:tumor protein p53-inducible protein 3
MGLECSGYLVDDEGTITEKKVMALLPGGGYSEYAKVKKEHIILLPENLDLAEAASIPEAWIVAYQLCKIVNLQKGDFALIHAAASGVGTALIQLVRLYEAQSICITSTDKKLTFCLHLGQGTAQGLLRKEKDKDGRIHGMTGNKGCSVIFDCVGATEFDTNLNSAAMDCRWINYGLLGGSLIGDFNLAKFLNKRINLHFSTLRSRSDEYKSKLLADFSSEIMPKFASKELSPIIDTIFDSVDHIKEAHHRMENDINIGKLVIKWH